LVPADPPQFPERWPEGATLHFRGYLFGIIPIGTHTIFIERIDPAARELQSREGGKLVRRWDHLVRVRPTGDGRTLYSDEILIEAAYSLRLAVRPVVLPPPAAALAARRPPPPGRRANRCTRRGEPSRSLRGVGSEGPHRR
jgi:hypothetical protein